VQTARQKAHKKALFGNKGSPPDFRTVRFARPRAKKCAMMITMAENDRKKVNADALPRP
jgi:hypothetical protein